MTTRTTDRRDVSDVVGELLLRVVWLLGKLAVALVCWAVLFPMISIPVAVTVLVSVQVSQRCGIAVAGVFIAGIMLWRGTCPEMFERWVTQRARARFLTWWRYRRVWDRHLTACGLDVRHDHGVWIPRLVGVEIGVTVDRVRLRMLAGQCPEDYDGRVVRLAHTFGAQECRAMIVGPSVVELVLRYWDPLADTIALPDIDGGRTA